MQKPTQHLLMLAASSTLALTALSTTADNHPAPKATKKIINEKIEGSSAAGTDVNDEIRARLQAHGIDPTTLDIDIDTTEAGDGKVVIVRAGEAIPLHGDATVFADDHAFMPLPNPQPLSEKAANCVLNRLPKMQTEGAAWLLREACQARYP